MSDDVNYGSYLALDQLLQLQRPRSRPEHSDELLFIVVHQSSELWFKAILHDLETSGHAQFIIATHSPIILAYPSAVILSLDGDRIAPVEYKETNHYKLTRDFLECPERYLRHLFAEGEEEE